MKYLNTFLIFCISTLFCYAQFSTFHTTDITKAVYDVNDMQPQEIRNYNKWNYQNWGEGLCLLHVNADRAHDNLIKAPAIIIGFVDCGAVTIHDEMPNYIGAQNISIQLINTSPKTIKTITFRFAFYNQAGTQVFDTKTGNPYCSLTFTNLKGRTSSNSHDQTALDLFKCYHLLTLNNATQKTLFYNKTIAVCKLKDVKVVYIDGTKSSKVSLVEQNCTSVIDFLEHSPFVPLFDSYNYSIIRGHSFMNEGSMVGIVDVARGTDDITKDTKVIHQEILQEIKEVPNETKEEPKHNIKPGMEEVYSSAAHMPSFPDGDAALLKYLNDHMRYPKAAAENNIQGKVIIKFVVTKTGKIGDVKVVRSVDKDLDKEAIRVCKSLPAFIPGRNAVGNPVNVWYTLPVTFKLTPVLVNMKTLIKEWEDIYIKYYNLLSL